MVKRTIHNTDDVSSNSARVEIKTPLARKATVDHPIKSTSLRILRALSILFALSLGSAKLEFEYAMQIVFFSLS